MSDTVPSTQPAAVPERDYKVSVFLVDDQPIVGEAVRRLLHNESDIVFHYCSTANTAVALASQLKPTVILQDLVLPEGDGLDFVEQFRANPATAQTPIIVLSTKEDPATKSRAFAVGANDYMVKIPDREELIARIRYHSRAYVNQLQRDIAFRALHESQRRLLQSNTALTALNKQLNEFVGMAAHDLRNPLGVVFNFSKFLLRDNAEQYSPQQLKFLKTIHSSADFMLRLVNDLLDVSKIEAGELSLNTAPTDVVALVEANVTLNQILASEKGMQIVVNADPDMPLVPIDAHRIEQVVTNLLTNAIKYSHPNTSVTVTIRARSHEIVLSVTDSGQGIPREELDRLFRPFGVTSVRATNGEKSTGLGLMIAKKVVDAHHGRIWVESVVGQGSTFSIALPTTPQTECST